MQLSDQLSTTTQLEAGAHTGQGAGRVMGRPILALSQPLPFSTQIRNGLSLLLLLTVVGWCWQPLVSLFSLTQQQEQYSHIMLIPGLSLYVFYLDRKAIFASREWSPWLGSLLIGLGAWSYWSADAAIFAPDQLSMTIMALVMMCWGIVVACFGITLSRQMSFGLLCLIFMVPLPSFLLEAIVGFLQRSSAEATAVLFSVLGIPVFRQEFVFSLSNFTIHVAEECSGIRSALALFFLLAHDLGLRAGSGLRQAEAGHERAVGDARQRPGLLLVAATVDDGADAVAAVAEQERAGRARLGQALDGEHRRLEPDLDASVFGRHETAEQAKAGKRGVDVGREGRLGVDGCGARRDHVAAEPVDRLQHQRPLLVHSPTTAKTWSATPTS